MSASEAFRVDAVPGGVGASCEAIADRARGLGVLGWGRQAPDGSLSLHAEGDPAGVGRLQDDLRDRSTAVRVVRVAVEGHEQFGVRGVSAGVFVVQEHAARPHHFDLRLEVGGLMRSWAVPKGPSLDPAAKRLAVEVGDHAMEHNTFEGPYDEGGVIIWDRGTYEHGGRVPWPQALPRGHAVFVLHGEKLVGGLALQRTGPGQKAQWLLIKRRDEWARPGSDIVAERPESVVSGRTLEDPRRARGSVGVSRCPSGSKHSKQAPASSSEARERDASSRGQADEPRLPVMHRGPRAQSDGPPSRRPGAGATRSRRPTPRPATPTSAVAVGRHDRGLG